MEEVKRGEAEAKATCKGFHCSQCKRPCCAYMLKEKVWLAAWPSYREDKRANPEIKLELCFACLREALGRSLSIDDFPLHPINSGIRLGFEMGLDYVLQRQSL